MKCLTLALVFAAGFAAAHLTGSLAATDPKPAVPPPPPNPSIDMNQFLVNARDAAKTRETHRLSEADFLKASKEEGTIVLDARSKEMFDLLHVKGAINLSFPDIDVVTLKKVLPDKKAKILIYCNNNFTPAPEAQQRPNQPPASPAAARAAVAFRPKSAPASLNLSTYVALHTYGYTNVYELAPLVDPATTKLELVPSTK